jgi:predicted Rossmann fold nucleotide-binding protein DprA/Smf involved in DNA uptake
MKVGIVGSREYPCLHKVSLFVYMLPVTTTIVSGGARGVDMTAVQTARTRNQPVRVFEAEWDRYGNSAGFRRNGDIVRESDVIVAFWDGVSKGTKHTIDLARKQGKPVLVITTESCG